METLIINKRRELPRSKRLIWDTVTVALWLGFLYLWKPILLIFYKIVTLQVPADKIADWIYENIHSVTFEHAVFVLCTTPVVLFTLSRLNRYVSPSEHLIYKPEDYADYFVLEHTQLQRCAASQLVTVYFDEGGHIIRLEDKIGHKSDPQGNS